MHVLVVIEIIGVREDKQSTKEEHFWQGHSKVLDLHILYQLHDNTFQGTQYQISSWFSGPCSTNWPWSQAKYRFFGFFSKKSLLCHRQMTSHFFGPLNKGKVSFCSQAQKGFQISKRIFTGRLLKKRTLSNFCFLLKIRSQFFKYLRVPTWKHCLISLIWPQAHFVIGANDISWNYVNTLNN